MTQCHSVYNMWQIFKISGKSSLVAPVAAGIGTDNSGNMPDMCALPGVPAMTSRAAHSTCNRPLELPTIDTRVAGPAPWMPEWNKALSGTLF